jgi:hypothetical protein
MFQKMFDAIIHAEGFDVIALLSFLLSCSLAVREVWKARSSLLVINSASSHEICGKTNVFFLHVTVHNPSSRTVCLTGMSLAQSAADRSKRLHSLSCFEYSALLDSGTPQQANLLQATLAPHKCCPCNVPAHSAVEIVLPFASRSELPALSSHQAVLAGSAEGTHGTASPLLQRLAQWLSPTMRLGRYPLSVVLHFPQRSRRQKLWVSPRA